MATEFDIKHPGPTAIDALVQARTAIREMRLPTQGDAQAASLVERAMTNSAAQKEIFSIKKPSVQRPA